MSPSQNFVDAFPMKSGYPIGADGSGFDERNPFENRDPRLAQYVIYNGMVFKGSVINTADHPSNGINRTEYSTCTGYYLRKFTNESVSLETGNVVPAIHFNTLMRFTEAFLIYAEAANEAWGPTGTGPNTYSAKDVMAKLRETAGLDQPDAYLASITSRSAMQRLIRNERRLELCFEQVRFWDVRRWKEGDKYFNVRPKGMNYNGESDADFFRVTEVIVQRKFMTPMHYLMPIPKDDINKNERKFVQNPGY